MHHPQPLPLTAEQIDNIHLAAFIVREERRLLQQLAAYATAWLGDGIGDVSLSVAIGDYLIFKKAYPRLPI